MRVGEAQDLIISGSSLSILMQLIPWSKAVTVMRY